MKKKIMIIVFVALAVFGSINIYWFVSVNNRYRPLLENIEKRDSGKYFMVDEDGYILGVKKPDYLSYVGNLVVSNNSRDNRKSLLIWPDISGGYTYGLRIPDKYGDTHEVYVNTSIKAINKEQQDIVDLNLNDTLILFDKAQKKWGLKYSIDTNVRGRK